LKSVEAVVRKRSVAAFGVLATLAAAAVASGASSPSHRFKTPGAPALPLAYHGFLWVAAHRGGTIYKINPKMNRIVHAYQTWESACYIGGSGNWIVYSSCDAPGVKVLNIRTGRMRTFGGGLRFVIPHRRTGVAYWDGNFEYAGSEWTTGPGFVVRRDPKTHVVLKRWSGIDGSGTATIAGRSIWTPGQTSVTRIDPNDDTLTIIPLPGALKDPGANQGYATVERAAVTPGTIWVTNPAGLYRINEHTNAAVHVPGISVGDLYQLGNIDLVAANGSLFMRNGPNSVVRIDPATGRITARYPASGGGGGIEVAYHSLWVTNFINDTTWRVPLG
jgi:hypothetical protein